jgi:transcriptional regulator with XRE-family HTH domain
MKERKPRSVVMPVSGDDDAADGGVSGDAENGFNEIVSSIGPKLRELRIQRGMSLQQLAAQSDVSAAAIHKIERGGMVPTITTLLKIAAAFNRPVSYFVEEQPGENRPVAHVRGEQRSPIFTAHRGIELAGISGPYGRFFLAGAVATVQPGAHSGDKPMEHPGEELILVLDGTFEIDVDGQHFALDEGDSLHFRTDRPHRWHNATAKPIKAVWLALRPF